MLLFSSELGMAWVFLWISLGLRTREIPWKTHAIPHSDEKSTTLHADQNYETVMKTASLHCNVVVFFHNCISLCSCSSMFHLGGPTQDFTILVQKVYNGRLVAGHQWLRWLSRSARRSSVACVVQRCSVEDCKEYSLMV